MRKVINITDLYHPYQDVGDNLDILTPYALPDVDLLLVVLDCTNKFRQPYAEHSQWPDTSGPREPGVVPITQLNYIFGNNIPYGVSPFNTMATPEDVMGDISGYQSQGVDMLLQSLERAAEPVDISVFGSLRAVAVAYNRNPRLLMEKVRMVHVSAGASVPNYLEWNVLLDPHAFVRVLRSPLPVTIYPCFGSAGILTPSEYCTFWSLNDMSFVKRMDKKLQNYLCYAYDRTLRHDFLRAMDEEPCPKVLDSFVGRQHNVWETAVWLEITGRKLVQRTGGSYRILPNADVLASDSVFKTTAEPCKLTVHDCGTFDYTSCAHDDTNKFIYKIHDPIGQELALNEALGEMYVSFAVPHNL